MKIPQIKVERTSNPTPCRSWDWAAWIDGMEETTTVVGATRAEVIATLIDEMTEECDSESGYAPYSLTR